MIILKDFGEIRVEVKITHKRPEAFQVSVLAREKQTQEVIKDLRVSLLKGEVELESYLSSTSAVNFEHVLLGKYHIEIADVDKKLAAVVLDIQR